jgi:hypothetical protein
MTYLSHRTLHKEWIDFEGSKQESVQQRKSNIDPWSWRSKLLNIQLLIKMAQPHPATACTELLLILLAHTSQVVSPQACAANDV